MADINPSQDYDVIHTLTFAAGSGTCKIRLYRGTYLAYTGTVYYRAGTSGAWTKLSVSGTTTTFPVSSTTMQIGHAHYKSGNDYMTASFSGQSTNLTGIAISQKAAYSGTMGNYFMLYYASDCAALTSLAVPDTSGLTIVGSSFMDSYAYNCATLVRLELPAAGWFVGHNINWSVPSGRLNYLKGYVTNSTDQTAWKALTASGKTLYLNYVRSEDDVILEGGVSDLSVSVYDSVTVSENVSILIPALAPLVSVYDSVTVSENVSILLPALNPSVYDSVTVSENISILLPALVPSVYDSVTISENVSILFPSLNPSVYDSVTVSENVSILLLVLKPSVYDSVTVSENVSILLPALVPSVYDSVTISEILGLMTSALLFSVFDEVSINEILYTLVGKKYSKGDCLILPSDSTDLDTTFTGQEYIDVEIKDEDFVLQSALGYAIYEFKDYVGTASSVSLEWEGQTDKAPSAATVYLQIYNVSTTAWDEVDTDNTSSVNTDFTLSGTIADLTNYKDGDSAISCRVYQQS